MFARIQKQCYSTFQKLGIPEPTINHLKTKYGISAPTQAQVDFIPSILSGKDIFLRDSTGTGKTFGIALALASQPQHPSLYLAPNQELATQVNHWIQHLVPDLTSPHSLVVNTPSQLDGHSLESIERIVLDEADQALRLPKRYATVRQTRQRQHHPKPAQLLLTRLMQSSENNNKKKPQLIVASATLNRPIRHWLTQQGWMDPDAAFIDITKGTQAPTRVQHHCLLISDDTIRNITPTTISPTLTTTTTATTSFDDQDDRMLESVAILLDLESSLVNNSVLFVDSSVSTATVQARMADFGIHAKDICDATSRQSSSSTQQQQQQKSTLWIATEFSARGMDLADISHVFILGQPPSIASYLHMAGRTGRLGQVPSGKIISLVRDHGRAESKMVNMFNLINVAVEPLEHVE